MLLIWLRLLVSLLPSEGFIWERVYSSKYGMQIKAVVGSGSAVVFSHKPILVILPVRRV